jgi:ABC-2 type transport system ATP-binding protein
MDGRLGRRTFESDPMYDERIPMNDFIVETHALTKRFGSRVAVDGVDLRIPRGSAFGYLGPNGAGKTTLIRMLLGLTPASSGTMQLRGMPVPERRAEALARVGAIVEEPRFHPFLTGRENLQIVAATHEPAAHARIEGALDLVGLANRADERVKQYSLGMRQRLGVARALLGDPELLILDEPTNGLDPAGILEFRGLVRRLVGEGRTVVLSSHLLDEVEKICDAVAIVDRGSVVWQGPIDAIHGGTRTVLVAVDDEPAALALLDRHEVEVTPEGIIVRLSTEAGPDVVAGLNRRLVTAGIGVHRLELSRASLEARFLEITSRLEEAA